MRGIVDFSSIESNRAPTDPNPDYKENDKCGLSKKKKKRKMKKMFALHRGHLFLFLDSLVFDRNQSVFCRFFLLLFFFVSV